MKSIFSSDIKPQSFLGLIRDQELELARTQKLKPLHILINTGLAALLFTIAVTGFTALDKARSENSRASLSHKQVNDQVVVCSLDTCRMTQTLDA
ncbi:hypothetical protein [Emcibacter sp.]|uniref:hypothetical protein n=1 Tax=Emcibacter sp. TaxID=1979954 RepID=UPI002AA6846B|nr:hypothetical protein [Emcibacter sp.]